jgi:hypothetical protein
VDAGDPLCVGAVWVVFYLSLPAGGGAEGISAGAANRAPENHPPERTDHVHADAGFHPATRRPASWLTCGSTHGTAGLAGPSVHVAGVPSPWTDGRVCQLAANRTACTLHMLLHIVPLLHTTTKTLAASG